MSRAAGVAIPEWAEWGQRAGLLLPYDRGTGPSGLPRCRWCDSECRPPRRKWCSRQCVREYQRVWNWAAVRRLVIGRDKSCQRCGTSEPKVPEALEGIRFDPWDVDHVVPVAHGGTDDPENLRLLCIPCHVEVGYEQRSEAVGQGCLDLEAAS